MTSVLITGAAGLIGQNLIARLKKRPGMSIIGIDKSVANTDILRRLHPEITIIQADMAHDTGWESAALDGVDVVVIAQAQIGGLVEQEFIDNNVIATEKLLTAIRARGGRRLVHISSSVVNSRAVDYYTESKTAQEKIVLASGNPCVVLRPTLMFGWFDRKHLGWLSRFMKKAPVFPVPGHGRYPRQPLYAGDFCAVIAACIANPEARGLYNISGQKKIDYIDLIRTVKAASGATTPIVKIPYGVFKLLLVVYALFNKNPPFTTKQLAALVIPEEFEVINWPSIFGVQATQLEAAMRETFTDPVYSQIVLEF
jgi:nucleoside-diphosphate-sugar epimerase